MLKNSVEGFEDLEDLKKFEDLLEEKNELVYLIWKVSLNLALRISDTLKITLEEAGAYLKKGYYLSKDKKTRKINRVKLNENTIKALTRAMELKKLQKNKDNIYLFSSNSNRSKSSLKAVTPVQVFRVYKEIVEWLGLEIHIGTHSARKTWGVQVYNKTRNIALVMERLNHSSEKSTLRYLGISQRKMDQVVEEFNL